MSWQVMRDYPLCGRWLCTALRWGELHRTDWVRRKELFFWGCMCFYWTTCKNTNTVNVALENLTRHSGSLGSWASGALLPPQDTLRKTAWRLLSRRGLLRCPWRLFPGPGHTFLLTSGSRLGASAAVAAAGLSSLLWGGWVAEDDLEREGGWNKCLGALLGFRKLFDDWLHGIAKEAGGSDRCVQKHLPSLRSAKVSHRCLCWTTMNPMVRPIAWAVRFVAISAKSVAARKSLTASGEEVPPSRDCRSLAWNTWSTAIACRAEGFGRCRAQVCSDSLLDGGHAHIPVGFCPVHLREHGLCRWMDSRRPRLNELLVDVGKKRHRRSRVYLTAAGPEVPGI